MIDSAKINISKTFLVRDLVFLGYILIVFSLPYDKLAINLGIIFLVVIWLISGNLKKKALSISNKPIFFLFLSLYLCYAIGLIYTSNLESGLFRLEVSLPIFLFPLVFGSSERISKSRLEGIFNIFLISCLLACIICLYMATYKNYLEGYTIVSAIEGFYTEKQSFRYQYFNYWYFTYDFLTGVLNIQAMYLAFLLAFALCLGFHLLINIRNTNHSALKVFYWLCMSMFFIVILLLSVRIVFLGLGLLFFIFIFYLLIIRKKIAVALSILSIVCVTTFTFLYLNPVTNQRVAEALNFSNSNYQTDNWGGRAFRMEIWHNAFDIIKKNPLVGVGSGAEQDNLNKIYLENDFSEAVGYNTHNEYLKTALELGIIGVIILLTIILIPLKLSFKRKSYLYLTFLILIAIFFLTENVLSRQIGVIFYSFFNSLFASYYFYD